MQTIRLEKALAIASRLSSEVEACGADPLKAQPWTKAIYQSLKQIAIEETWSIFPAERPYFEEYLVDFTLFEKNYGCRLACESQWRSYKGDCDWAFWKLVGLKSDVKILLSDATTSILDELVNNRLRNYAQLTPDEIFIFLQWKDGSFVKTWWKPGETGVQGSFVFAPF